VTATKIGGTVAVLAILVLACSGKTSSATSSERICTPGAYVYCRCQDRQEGTKLCHDDGAGFDKCLPCETATNPEVPVPPGETPPTGQDAGDDAPVGPGKCGDKIVQQDEDCDDGNTDDSDGCDTSCRLSGTDPPASRSCPGLDVHVWGTARAVTLTSTTTGAPNTASANPACPSAAGNFPTNGAASNDRLFHVTAHRTGLMTVSTGDTNFDNWIYVSETCAAGENTYITCSNKVQGVGSETLSFPVDAGKSYTVFVDGSGISGNEGAFRVTFNIM
jgi:cysteine-rich repeat protein